MADAGTLLELIERNAAEHPGVLATVDGPDRLTWSQYRQRARAIALALLDLGVEPGEVVGLHMANRAEHVLADVGALFAAATPTSYYNTLAADQLAYVAADSAAVVAIVDPDQLGLWLSVRDRLPALRHLVVLDREDPPDGVHSFAALITQAQAAVGERGAGDVLALINLTSLWNQAARLARPKRSGFHQDEEDQWHHCSPPSRRSACS